MAGQRSAELRERAGNGVCEPKPQPRLKRIGDVAFDNNDPIYVVNGSPYYLSIPIGWNNGVAFIVFFLSLVWGSHRLWLRLHRLHQWWRVPLPIGVPESSGDVGIRQTASIVLALCKKENASFDRMGTAIPTRRKGSGEVNWIESCRKIES